MLEKGIATLTWINPRSKSVYKHFTDLLLKLSRWIVWLFLRRVSLMNGWPVSRWIFFVSKDRNIKNRFDWHCARVVAVAWQKKTAFTLALICLDWIVETMHAVQEPAATKENIGLTLIFDWVFRASIITCVLKKDLRSLNVEDQIQSTSDNSREHR